MPGGMMQLVAFGHQDVYLTGNPQITFFKIVYRRHTNFAMEDIEQVFDATPGFGKRVACKIARNGDLVHDIYLQVTLPALTQSQNSSTWHGYANSIGNVLINYVDIRIGGQIIERHYGEWLEMYSELYLNESKRKDYNAMIGKYESNVSLETNATTNRTYYIPLRFWFCRNVGLALPLISLLNHDVNIEVQFRNLSNITKADTDITSPTQSSDGTTAEIIDASLYIKYIYLGDNEKVRFAQQSHEYLIERVQRQPWRAIDANTLNERVKLQFQDPVKELVWGITTDTNLESNTSTGNNIMNFSSTSGSDTFNTMRLQMKGQDRFSVRNAEYFRLVQPYEHNTGSRRKYVYTYSFALKPEEHQPSGSVNMSKMDEADMFLTFTQADVVASQLKIFAVSYNVLRIANGMGGLAF
jgi:hypothetical protein